MIQNKILTTFRYKDNKEISPTDKAKPVKVSDTKYELQIPDSTKDDAAEYKVSFRYIFEIYLDIHMLWILCYLLVILWPNMCIYCIVLWIYHY